MVQNQLAIKDKKGRAVNMYFSLNSADDDRLHGVKLVLTGRYSITEF